MKLGSETDPKSLEDVTVVPGAAVAMEDDDGGEPGDGKDAAGDRERARELSTRLSELYPEADPESLSQALEMSSSLESARSAVENARQHDQPSASAMAMELDANEFESEWS